MCCAVVLLMDSVLCVLWRGFLSGQCAVCVVGVVLLMDSLLYVLWCGFVNGQFAVCFVAKFC